MPKKPAKVSGERGTPLWAVNSLRMDGIARLLDDLVDLEQRGLEEQQCEKVRNALDKLASEAAAIPDGSFWRGSIYQEIEHFAELYSHWNTHQGGDRQTVELRRDALKSLRFSRHQIAKKIRENQHVLQNELDLELVEGMYGALHDLTTALPDIFKNVAKAVARFEARKVG